MTKTGLQRRRYAGSLNLTEAGVEALRVAPASLTAEAFLAAVAADKAATALLLAPLGGSGFELLRGLLAPILWRNTAERVRAVLALPPTAEHVLVLKPAAGEGDGALDADDAARGHTLLLCEIDAAFVDPAYWRDGKLFTPTHGGLPRLLSFAGSQRFAALNAVDGGAAPAPAKRLRAAADTGAEGSAL